MKSRDVGTIDGIRATSSERAHPPASANRKVNIRRHSMLGVATRLPLAGLWIGLRFLFIPALWLPLKFGSRMSWAFAFDTFMKRLLFPLTERPDDTLQNAIGLLPSHTIANLTVIRHGRPLALAEFAGGRPLLLILYRGSWCPYSRLHLADLATLTESLSELRVSVLAVSAYNHERWWNSKGVFIPFATDPNGQLFRTMGVHIEPSLAHRAWGMLLPHESVFLFDADGKMVTADVRRLSSTKSRQTFLASTRWLAEVRQVLVGGTARRS